MRVILAVASIAMLSIFPAVERPTRDPAATSAAILPVLPANQALIPLDRLTLQADTRPRPAASMSPHRMRGPGVQGVAAPTRPLLPQPDRSQRSRDISDEVAPPAVLVAVSPCGRFKLTRHPKNLVFLNDGVSGWTCDLPPERAIAVSFASGRPRFATGAIDGLVRVWNAELGRVIRELPGHVGPVNAVAFAPDGTTLVSGGQDGGVYLWSVLNFETQRIRLSRSESGPIDCVALSPDGRLLAFASHSPGPSGGSVSVLDRHTLEELAVLSCASPVGAVEFRDGGETVVSGEWDGRVTFWSLSLARPRAVAFVSKELIDAANFSPDTRALSRVEPEIEVGARRLRPAGSETALRTTTGRSDRRIQDTEHRVGLPAAD